MSTTNRPFFSNFFAAFRAQSAWKAAPSTSTTTAAVAASAQLQSLSTLAAQHSSAASSAAAAATAASASHPRSIPAKSAHSSSPAAAAAIQGAAHFQARTVSTSPIGSPAGFQRSRTPSRTRRGANEDDLRTPAAAAASDKWYIGGRTASGEESFYKLGLVRKYNSNDKLSLDRLSLE